MNGFEAVALYVGLNILIVLALIVNIVRHRQAKGVSLGDGGYQPLMLAIRAHANAIETAPICLLGLMALAMTANAVWLIHVGGLLLTLGRAAHGYGLSTSNKPNMGRKVGMLMTLIALVWVAIACILSAF
jgi:uncharacterized protein